VNRVDLDPLLQELEESLEGPAVTAIGGGHGLARTLEAVQRYASSISAIVGVADNGGSSGRLSPALDIPPPGDIRRAMLALTPNPSLWRELFAYRFTEGDVKDHSLGNLILAALTDLEDDFEVAIRTAELYLGAAGAVIPVARRRLHLQAVVDGRLVDGQLAVARTRGDVSELRLVPEDVPANPRALDALAEADQIVIGPGSLYTSLIAPLLVPGVVDTINAAGARLVYVCNLVTQDGETLGMDATDHLAALTGLTGMRMPDAIVANETAPVVPPPVEAVRVDPTALAGLGVTLESCDLVDPAAPWPAHDPVPLGSVLGRLAVA